MQAHTYNSVGSISLGSISLGSISLALALGFFAGAPRPAHALDVGAHAPALGVKDAKDRVVTIPRGKVVLVDIWASWCGPCKKELPALQRMYRKHSARGFRVIAVNIDKDRKNADAFLASHPVSFSVAYDPESSVPAKYSPKTMPSSYLIDHRGIVKQVYTGYHDGDDAKLEKDVIALLEALPAPKEAQAKPAETTAASGGESAAPAEAPSAPVAPTATTPAGADEPQEPTAAAQPSATDAPATDTAAPADGRPKSVAPSSAGKAGGLCSVLTPRTAAAPAWSYLLAGAALALRVRRKRHANV